jgi:hypothetical protein
MKFLEIINKKLAEINEQGPQEQMPSADPAAAPLPATPPVPTEQPADSDQNPLTSEGEVFLVRLLRKALFMNPGDLDEKALKDLPEINETNASQVLTSIVDIMKKYSNSIDVNTEPKE